MLASPVAYKPGRREEHGLAGVWNKSCWSLKRDLGAQPHGSTHISRPHVSTSWRSCTTVVAGVSSVSGSLVTKIASKNPEFRAASYWTGDFAINSCWLKTSLCNRSLDPCPIGPIHYLRLLPQYSHRLQGCDVTTIKLSIYENLVPLSSK
jgi:hypothetical protein